MTGANNINIQESVQILVDYLKGNNLNRQWSTSIAMVPSRLRDVSPNSFNPRVVSIGPLHHEDENLTDGEQLKKNYVHHLLVQLDLHIEQTLEECLSKVNESINKIRECYVGMKPYSDDELARIMVIDGCFILGYILFQEIISDCHRMNTILEDLLLVENQIPFIVLNDIFGCTILKDTRRKNMMITDVILRMCRSTTLFKRILKNPNISHNASDHDHILGLLHKCYKPVSTISSTYDCPSIRTVIELEKAGVTFKPNQDASWLMDIKIEWLNFACLPWFKVRPTLKMPILKIYDNTEVFLRNIIAYEQTSKVDPYFTSLAAAIDGLVDSGHDIAKLVESKIIINNLGSNEEAASMINSICKHVIVDSFYAEQWQELETYYNNYWPKHIAWLRLTYFNSPWNIIALLAAFVLFTLTMIQTYFTINPRK